MWLYLHSISCRVSFPSLLYLKHQLESLLENCKKPKAQVLFQPGWVETSKFVPKQLRECLCGKYTDPQVDDVGPCYHDCNKATLHATNQCLIDVLKKGKNVGFPPGSVVHIKTTKKAAPLCLGYCYPNKLSVEHISSEDLCVLEMGREMFDDHLPNAVLNALKMCKKEFLQGIYVHIATLVNLQLHNYSVSQSVTSDDDDNAAAQDPEENNFPPQVHINTCKPQRSIETTV